MNANPSWKEIFRFAIVGVLNTSLDLLVFSILFYLSGASLLFSNSAAYVLATTNSFFINKHWTFSETRHRGRTHRQYTAYLVLGVVGLGLSNGIVWSLALLMPEIAAKLLSVGVLFVWNFALSKLVVFSFGDAGRTPPAPDAGPADANWPSSGAGKRIEGD